MGIAPDRIVTETRSRNTSENAGFSLPLAAPAPGETWVLVTSAFHMPRAMESFRRAGWPDLTAFPVDHRAPPNWARLTWDFTGNLGKTEIAIKEYVGLLAYGILGR